MKDNFWIEEIQDIDRWNSFVIESPFGSIFQKFEWLEEVRKSQNGELRLLGFYRKGNLIAGCPLIKYQKGPFKLVSSNPGVITRYGGILFASLEEKKTIKKDYLYKQVVDIFNDYLNEQKFHCVALNLNYHYEDIRPFIWNDWQVKNVYTYISDLSDIDALWKSINPKIRRSHKICRQNDFHLEINGDIEDLIKTIKLTYSSKDLIWSESLGLIRNIYQLIKDKGWGCQVILKDKQENIISGRLILWDEKRSYYCLAGTNRDYLENSDYAKHEVNQYFDWEIIKLASQRTPEMDWCGANIWSVSLFKSKFGPKLVPYVSVYKKSTFFSLAESAYIYLKRTGK